MALTAGSRVGPYEISRSLGAGGMGEVYRARDTRLKRDVALKILPESFAADPDRLARFQREAEVLASLNHPHVAQIYGVEEASVTGEESVERRLQPARIEGQRTRALVMELVDGSTLADRVAHGPIPLDEALPIAKQIAEALEAAHEQGIIHRDLKPANIKVKSDGTVKVLDFGLAKALEPALATGVDATVSPTITSPAMTQLGVILGTAAYMSPEQAKGRQVDKRSDIWAFGAILFEMLTGRRAFAGDDISDTLAAVLRAEPDWTLLPRGVSPALGAYIRRCLQKDPRHRVGDAQTLRLALEGAFETAAEVRSFAVARRREQIAWTAVALLLAVAIALAFLVARRTTLASPEMRVEITMPATSSPLHFALSPDGRRLVFVASGDGQARLWVRSLDAAVAQPLAGTENAEYPFWSPDSRSIGFFAGGKLKRVAVGGGPPQEVANAPAGRGGAWSPDGTMLFAASNAGPLSSVSTKIGEPSVVTRMASGHTSHRFPQFLPDGRHFIFFVQGNPEAQGIYFGSLDGEEPRRLIANDIAGAWAPGRMLYMRQGTLVATPFDEEKGEVIGEPVTVADPVGFEANFNLGGFSVSTAGLVAYRAGGGFRRLTWFGRDGKPAGTPGAPDENIPSYPELSPDGRRVALQRTVQSNTDVWIIDVVRGGSTRFTFDAAIDGSPVWSPDGMRIAFRSTRDGGGAVYVKASSGAGNEEFLGMSTTNMSPLSWSADGRFLLFWDIDPKRTFDLWTHSFSGDAKASPWLNGSFTETLGQFSPDGRWVAYQSNESGPFEIYVQPFPTASAKWQISTQGGTMPRWREDGKELFFIAPDEKLMAAAVITSDTAFETSAPVSLFQTRIVGGPGQILKHQYAVSSDGRFLIVEPAEGSAPPPITLILNWQPPS